MGGMGPRGLQRTCFPAVQKAMCHGGTDHDTAHCAAPLQEWRKQLDEAVEHFKGAGCAEVDIRGALKNHYCAAQLDLGPDPEPEQVACSQQLTRYSHLIDQKGYKSWIDSKYFHLIFD